MAGAPESEAELLARCRALAGKTLGQVARELAVAVPPDQKRHKGWTGELAERCLGATASTRAEPDFQLLGVELKTVPIDRRGLPRESTYICTLTLSELTGASWRNSTVKKKLTRVLWLPVEADPALPLRQRRFGEARIWGPTPEQESVLETDWEEIMELVTTGELDRLSSSQGRYLQVRPKAANAAALGPYDQGMTLPRGFYLRSSFTRTILCEE